MKTDIQMSHFLSQIRVYEFFPRCKYANSFNSLGSISFFFPRNSRLTAKITRETHAQKGNVNIFANLIGVNRSRRGGEKNKY